MGNSISGLEQHLIADLSNRAVFKLVGPDAERYLNGQISQDVSRASEQAALYSVVSNFKGKLEGDCYIRRHEDAILIDTSQDQRESLFMRLDKYLIADDAELIDVSDEYQLSFSSQKPDTLYWEIQRYGVQGYDFLSKDDGAHYTSDAQLDAIRITNKIPKWGHELTNDILPADAAIEERAISFTKGCYTGQEVISRMKSSGKTNRHLVLLECEKSLSLPSDLFTNADDTKPSATLTSICELDGKYLGLGYRTRKAETKTSFLSKEGIAVSVI